MNHNWVVLKGIKNKIFNYKKLFTIKDSLIWKDCSNITINIKSKINKIIFEHCNNITLKISHTISGIEINKSSNIKIKTRKNQSLNNIECYRSDIIIKLYPGQEKEINIISEFSNINIKKYKLYSKSKNKQVDDINNNSS